MTYHLRLPNQLIMDNVIHLQHSHLRRKTFRRHHRQLVPAIRNYAELQNFRRKPMDKTMEIMEHLLG